MKVWLVRVPFGDGLLADEVRAQSSPRPLTRIQRNHYLAPGTRPIGYRTRVERPRSSILPCRGSMACVHQTQNHVASITGDKH